MKLMSCSVLILIFTIASSIPLYGMEKKDNYEKLKGSEGDLYVTDEVIDFEKVKMRSTGSLDALTYLREKEILFNQKDLESRGLEIIKQKPFWRRFGGTLRRYTTTLCVVGTTTMVGIFMYYLYTAKSDIKKAGDFINQVSPFINKAEETFDNINQLIKDICEKFNLPVCSQIKN